MAKEVRIAHLAGPTATIHNAPPLVTSNKARARHGLPLLKNADGIAGLISARATVDFYRGAPPGGYKKGLPEHLRTDEGKGDIPPETRRLKPIAKERCAERLGADRLVGAQTRRLGKDATARMAA